MVRLTHLTTVLISLPLIFAHPSPRDTFVALESRDSKGGCGSHTTPEILAAAAELAAQDEIEASSLSASKPKPLKNIKVKTWIHVVAGSKKLEDGWIPDSQLKAQMKVLNDNFAPSKISFKLEGVTRTINANWTIDTEGSELEMKKALRKGDYKTLNIYFQKRLWEEALGYAYYPTNVTKKSDEFYLDGATNKYNTVPGGNQTNYDLGKTVTHEVGHWFGLIHTFEGYSCEGPGDLIADTAIHNAPTSGCPIGLDTCPDSEGPDPIHNYMDYSYDACYEEFTPLQTKRAHDMWYLYRA